MPMTKEQLLAELKRCHEDEDTESGHYIADHALLDFIGDPEITAAWEKLHKWFA